MALTELQTRLCQEFLRDLNARAAAQRAGYSPTFARKAAHRELAKPELAAYLDSLRGARTERTRISIDEVIRRLLRLADRAETEGELTAAMRALELLGKHLAMFTEKLDVTQRNPFTSGSDPAARAADLARLLRIASPGAPSEQPLNSTPPDPTSPPSSPSAPEPGEAQPIIVVPQRTTNIQFTIQDA